MQGECCELQQRLSEADQNMAAAKSRHAQELSEQQSGFERQSQAIQEEHNNAMTALKESTERCTFLGATAYRELCNLQDL